MIHGDPGDDTIVSGLGNDEIFGDAGSNTLAYVSVSQSGIPIVSRSGGVLVRLPEPGSTGTGGAIGGQEKDVVHDGFRTLIGSNGGDFLVGSDIADTMLGAAPVGTGSGVVDSPAGNDTILGRGGDDSIVGGDHGQIGGGEGNDTIVGGRSTASSALTVIHGNPGNDTIVSGLGNDEIFGDAGSNTLAYASVEQQGLDIVDGEPTGSPPSCKRPGRGPRREREAAGRRRTRSTPTSALSSAATATTSSSATTSATRSSASLRPAPRASGRAPRATTSSPGSAASISSLAPRATTGCSAEADPRRAHRRRRQRPAARPVGRRQLQRRGQQRHQPRPRRRRRGDPLRYGCRQPHGRSDRHDAGGRLRDDQQRLTQQLPTATWEQATLRGGPSSRDLKNGDGYRKPREHLVE